MSDDRVIRVFISSTFRDMQAERDYLVKFTFPELRKLCESRGVGWGEVDLRWGITDEQKAEGKVLPICLEEIHRCRPYFIGILGSRYGKIADPVMITTELLEREPWLKEHVQEGKSVTELEILHGVLNNPTMAGQAFFYFRDPACCQLEEKPEKVDKLKRLKQRIRDSKFPVHENYREPKDLGEQVGKDLKAVIDRLYPEGSQPDPLDREVMDHEAYAQSRRQVYIGGDKYFDRLDAHAAAQDDQPLVVLGESGSGKSALLANWVHRYAERHPNELIIQHYIGASPYSADWAAMLRRIMGEFKRKFGIQREIPDNPDVLRSAFPNWLYMAASKGKVVLALDALNQLEDRDGAPDLVWLPPVMPANVRLVVSTLPGRALDEIRKRNWTTMDVEPLTQEYRRDIIANYLSRYAKTLTSAQLQRIVQAPQSANPLYLHVLLNELRLFGIFEKLDQRINGYLQAKSPYELYQKVIARWEDDYEGETDLVGDTLSLLWASRRGLSEGELLEALGTDGNALPRAIWSPLFLAISDSLVSRGGLLTFAHDFLRAATCDAYLPSLTNQRTAHRRLAKYFVSAINDRAMDELPWQLVRAEAWSDLHRLFSDPIIFSAFCSHNLDEVVEYWVALRRLFDPATTYESAWNMWMAGDPEIEIATEAANHIGQFLNAFGLYPAAEQFVRRALNLCERYRGINHVDTVRLVNNLATVLTQQGNYVAAEPMLQKLFESRKHAFGTEDRDTLKSMVNLAYVLEQRSEYTSAESLLSECLETAERILAPEDELLRTIESNFGGLLERMHKLVRSEELLIRAVSKAELTVGANHPSTLRSLNNLGLTTLGLGKLPEAEAHFRRALAGFETTLGPTHPNTLTSSANLARVLIAKGDLRQAAPLARRALEGRTRVFGEAHSDTVVSMHIWATLLHKQGELEAAEAFFRKAIASCEVSLGVDHQMTIDNMLGLAELLKEKSDYASAEQLYRQILDIQTRRDGSEHPATVKTSLRLADVLLRSGNDSAAEALYGISLPVAERTLGSYDADRMASMFQYGRHLANAKKYGEAVPMLHAAFSIVEHEMGQDDPRILPPLTLLGSVLSDAKDYPAAVECYQRALTLNDKAHGLEHPESIKCAEILAALLFGMKHYEEAEPLCRRCLAVRQKSNGFQDSGTIVWIRNLGTVLQNMGRFDDTENLYRSAMATGKDDAEKKSPSDKEFKSSLMDLATKVSHAAIDQAQNGAFGKAEELFRRALAICEEVLGPDHPNVGAALNNLAALLQEIDRSSEAEPLVRRALAISEKPGGTSPACC